ncbi:hypothetical protein FRB97_005892 [Tulasnella sp. 331]|nr:hypothetical protein FRB97_005892 [Tulasnella sp. 331]
MARLIALITFLSQFILTVSATDQPLQLSHPPNQRRPGHHHTRSTRQYVNAAYYANWDIYDEMFYPSSLPAERLTHIFYAFANIGTDGTVSSSDTWADLQYTLDSDNPDEAGNNVYGNVKQLHLVKLDNRNLKVSLSIGGGSGSANFPAFMNDPIGRATFISTSVQLMVDWGLDGIDIDWEYPDVTNIDGLYQLMVGLRVAIDDLARAMDTSPFFLSIAVSPGVTDMFTGYVSKIDSVLDFWNLMAYDFCGAGWQPITCDIANLRGGGIYGNTTEGIQYFTGQGATRSKIIMGEPLYGYAYSNTTGRYQPYDGTPPGDYGEAGEYDLDHLPLSANTTFYEDFNTVTSYTFDKVTKVFESFDTPAIARVKAAYVVAEQLGGAFYWKEISGDWNITEKSLVYQFYDTFETIGGLIHSCNHVAFPNSTYDNIKNTMGIKPKACSNPPGPTSWYSAPVATSTSASHSSTSSISATVSSSLSSSSSVHTTTSQPTTVSHNSTTTESTTSASASSSKVKETGSRHKRRLNHIMMLSLADASRVTGIVAAGVMTGYSINTSSTLMPVLIASDLSARKKVLFWNEWFERGLPIAMVGIPLSCIPFWIAAYLLPPPPSLVPTTKFGISSRTQLIVAGLAAFSNLPFSSLFVLPQSVTRLRARTVALMKHDKDVEDVSKAEAELRWFGTACYVRAVPWTVAMVLGAMV